MATGDNKQLFLNTEHDVQHALPLMEPQQWRERFQGLHTIISINSEFLWTLNELKTLEKLEKQTRA